MRESQTDTSRYLEDLRATRKRLGEHFFEDKKVYKKTVRLLSDLMNKSFKNQEIMKQEVNKVVNGLLAKGLPITPALVTLLTCSGISKAIQHGALLGLVGHEKGGHLIESTAATLDFLKGFQGVVSANQADFHTPYGNKLHELRRLIEQSPKGFLKDQVEFWRSSERMRDGSIQQHEDRALIIAGAELAPKAYRIVYPIAEKFLSSIRYVVM